MSSLLAYQLTRDGTLQKIEAPFLEFLVSKNVLCFYNAKPKHLYIWIGRNASQTVKSNIANIQGRLLEMHSGLVFLRQITIEDGDEPFTFLQLLSLSKSEVEAKENEFKQMRQKEIENVKKGLGESKRLFEDENYSESLSLVNQMHKRAIDLDVDELVEAAEKIRKVVKDKQNYILKKEEVKKELAQLEKALESSLTIEKAITAYEISEKIRRLSDFHKEIELSESTSKNIEQARDLYDQYMKQTGESERKYYSGRAKLLEYLSYKDFDGAKEIFDELKTVSDESMDNKILKDYKQISESFIPKYEKWKKDQENLAQEEKELNAKIYNLKSEIRKAIEEEDVEKANVLLNQLEILVPSQKNEEERKILQQNISEYKKTVANIEEKQRVVKLVNEDLKIVENKEEEGQLDEAIAILQKSLELAKSVKAEELVKEVEDKIEKIDSEQKKQREYEDKIKYFKHQIEVKIDVGEYDSAETEAQEILKVAQDANDEENIEFAKNKLDEIVKLKEDYETSLRVGELRKEIEAINIKDKEVFDESKAKLEELLKNPDVENNSELTALVESKIIMIENLSMKSQISEKIASIEKSISENEFDKASELCKELLDMTQSSLYDEERTYGESKLVEIEKMKNDYEEKLEKDAINEEINQIPEPVDENVDDVIQQIETKMKEEKVSKYPEFQEILNTKLENAKAVKENKENIQTIKEKLENAKALSEKEDYTQALSEISEAETIAKNVTDKEILDEIERIKVDTKTKLTTKEDAEKAKAEIQEGLQNTKTFISDKRYNEAEKELTKIKNNYTESSVEPFKNEIAELEASIAKGNERRQEALQRIAVLNEQVESDLKQRKYLSASENCQSALRIGESINLEQEEMDKMEQKYKEIEKLLQEERDKLKVEREEVMKTLDSISEIMEPEKDVLPDVVELSIQDTIGDLSGDLDSLMNSLNQLIETQRVEIKQDITSKSVLRSKSGQVIEMERKTTVMESMDPVEDQQPDGESEDAPSQPKKGPVKLSVTSGLENPLDDVIEEAIMKDIIPYNFEVSEFHVEGFTMNQEPEKEMTKEGLQYTWVMNDIQPKSKVEVHYDLRRRVSRTVIVPVQDQLKVIKTHSNLEFLNVEGLYDAKLKFSNRFEDRVSGIVIEDIIPVYYLFNIQLPDNMRPRDVEKSTNGALVKWNIPDFDKGQVAIHQYRLIEIYKYEDLKILSKKLSKEAIGYVEKRDLRKSLEPFNKILFELKSYNV